MKSEELSVMWISQLLKLIGGLKPLNISPTFVERGIARHVKVAAIRYVLDDVESLRKATNGILYRCVDLDEAMMSISEVHEGFWCGFPIKLG